MFDEAKSVLARFGYRTLGADEVRDDWAAMWELLKADFRTRARPFIADFASLREAEREAAIRYMAARLEADRLLERCEAAHGRLAGQGIDAAAVEAFANARESYENMVQRFGETRAELETLLSASASPG
ncbi:MAG: hypothetical protein KIT20_06795 [Alphaproteobacteria bacterium]|nr:hypothetical protein [Alphaproteobacteria bacterium]